MTDTNAQRFTLHNGDCLEVMRAMPENSIDSIVTDPPYGLAFMGKDWDHGVPGVPFWAEALRVAKPGAMLLAFGGTRTFHRLTCAIEDAGWEIRDCVMWMYGSGFPKSHNISKAIDKAAGAEREVVGSKLGRPGVSKNGNNQARELWRKMEGRKDRQPPTLDITAPATPEAATWDGYGTALKPAWEPIIVAMKPTDGTFANNALTWGVAGLNVDGCRVKITDGATMARNNKPGENGWMNSSGGPNNAALNGEPSGRWPANVIHDGSDEVTAGFPVSKSATNKKATPAHHFTAGNARNTNRTVYENGAPYSGDIGSAARFFMACPQDEPENAKRFLYQSKASRAERNAGLEGLQSNVHPTVKPLSLLKYLCRLTKTPTGGVVLDPFMGSGTTGIAAILEGRDFIGIDNEAEYAEIARRRIEHHMPDELPLFKEAAD